MVQTRAELADYPGVLLRRLPGAGPGRRRGASRRLLWRAAVELWQPGRAELGIQWRAAVGAAACRRRQTPGRPGLAAGVELARLRRRRVAASSVHDRAGGRPLRLVAVRARRRRGRRCRLGPRAPSYGLRSSAGSSGSRLRLFRGASGLGPAGPARSPFGARSAGAVGASGAPVGRDARSRREPRRRRSASVSAIARGDPGGLERRRSGAPAAADDARDAELVLGRVDPQHKPRAAQPRQQRAARRRRADREPGRRATCNSRRRCCAGGRSIMRCASARPPATATRSSAAIRGCRSKSRKYGPLSAARRRLAAVGDPAGLTRAYCRRPRMRGSPRPGVSLASKPNRRAASTMSVRNSA